MFACLCYPSAAQSMMGSSTMANAALPMTASCLCPVAAEVWLYLDISHCVLVQGEIGEHDPHHGPRAVGASALQKALARIQGDKAEQIMSKYTAPEEVLELPGHCLACNAEAVTRVFQTSIPYFKVPGLFPSWLSVFLSCPPVGSVHLHLPTLARSWCTGVTCQLCWEAIGLAACMHTLTSSWIVQVCISASTSKPASLVLGSSPVCVNFYIRVYCTQCGQIMSGN